MLWHNVDFAGTTAQYRCCLSSASSDCSERKSTFNTRYVPDFRFSHELMVIHRMRTDWPYVDRSVDQPVLMHILTMYSEDLYTGPAQPSPSRSPMPQLNISSPPPQQMSYQQTGYGQTQTMNQQNTGYQQQQPGYQQAQQQGYQQPQQTGYQQNFQQQSGYQNPQQTGFQQQPMQNFQQPQQTGIQSMYPQQTGYGNQGMQPQQTGFYPQQQGMQQGMQGYPQR